MSEEALRAEVRWWRARWGRGARGGATATRPPVSPFLPVHSVQCYASSAEQKDGSIPNRKGGRRSFLFRKLDLINLINSLHSLELRKESQIGEGFKKHMLRKGSDQCRDAYPVRSIL